MPPKPVKPRGTPRKCPRVDPDPSSDDPQQTSENSPVSNPVPDTSAEEGPSGTLEPMSGPSETLPHERELQSELDISASVHNIEQKIDHFVSLCDEERQKFHQESQEFLTLIEMWKIDAEQVKKHREKLANLLEEQQNLYQQFQAAQNQKMEEFQELCEQYLKGLENVEDCRRTAIADEIKTQMDILEREVAPESQCEERAGGRQ